MIESILRGHSHHDFYCYHFEDCVQTVVQPYESKFNELSNMVSGSFNKGVQRIEKISNMYLYGQFLLKKEEYETQGTCYVKQLFHDTASHKVDSIIQNNLDWRLSRRVKYGQGVSFSPSPSYANRQSSRDNGTSRAMILADVLIQNEQYVGGSLQLPSEGYDTTIGNGNQVYVKYYDDEFYPKYIIYYESNFIIYRRRYF